MLTHSEKRSAYEKKTTGIIRMIKAAWAWQKKHFKYTLNSRNFAEWRESKVYR